jgi:uncharacterized membrane protein
MATTAWRFSGTEGAEEAIVLLKQLEDQDLIDLQDVAVVRWPRYASVPIVAEHVTESGKFPSLTSKLKHNTIDGSMIQAVKGDVPPGGSALVLLSTDTAVDKVVMAFRGQAMELVRSDLSVQQQDALRAAFRQPG